MQSPRKQRNAECLRAVRAWQITEVENGLVEAGEGDFATQTEVEKTFDRLTKISYKRRSPKK